MVTGGWRWWAGHGSPHYVSISQLSFQLPTAPSTLVFRFGVIEAAAV